MILAPLFRVRREPPNPFDDQSIDDLLPEGLKTRIDSRRARVYQPLWQEKCTSRDPRSVRLRKPRQPRQPCTHLVVDSQNAQKTEQLVDTFRFAGRKLQPRLDLRTPCKWLPPWDRLSSDLAIKVSVLRRRVRDEGGERPITAVVIPKYVVVGQPELKYMAQEPSPHSPCRLRPPWSFLGCGCQSPQRAAQQGRTVRVSTDVLVRRSIVAIFSERHQRASTHECMGPSMIHVVVLAAHQRPPLSRKESQEQCPRSRRYAGSGHGCRCECPYRCVEPRRQNRVSLRVRYRLSQRLFQLYESASSDVRFPTPHHAVTHGLRGDLQPHLMMARTRLRTRRVPNVIQPTREVEPHFIRDRSCEPEAGTRRAIERGRLVPSARNGSQFRGDGKEQQRQDSCGAPVRAVLKVSLFDVERPQPRLALSDPKHSVRGDGQRIKWDICTIHELRFEGCGGHQSRRVPRVAAGRSCIVDQSTGNNYIDLELLTFDGSAAAIPKSVAND